MTATIHDDGEALLLAVQRSPDSLPTHMASSIKHGTVCILLPCLVALKQLCLAYVMHGTMHIRCHQS